MNRSGQNVQPIDGVPSSDKGGEFVTRLAAMLNEALARSDRDGIPRKVIATRLGLQTRTVNTWVAPSHGTKIPSEKLLELIVSDRLMSAAARRQLLADIAQLAGCSVCDDTEEDPKPAPDQVTEICAALGQVASLVRVSSNPRGPGGKAMTAEERKELHRAIDEAVDELGQLKRATGGRGAR